jgi:drug/metabolite transporter (DMT)-like permease
VASILFGNPIKWQSLRKNWKPLLGLGFIGYFGLYGLQLSGLKSITSSESAAIMLLAPLFTVAIEVMISKKMNVINLISSVLGFIGASLILLKINPFLKNGNENIGIKLTIAAALCLGLSVVQTRKILTKESSDITIIELTFYSMLIGLLIFLPFSDWTEYPLQFKNITFSNLFSLLYLSLICSAFSFYLWNWSLKYISSSVASVSMYIKTPTALAVGALLVKEDLPVRFYYGTALIFIAVIISQKSKRSYT